MVFNSLEFILFFPIVALVFNLLPHKFGKIFLICASIFFYASYNITLCSFLLLAIVFNYIIGLAIQKSKNDIYSNLLLFFGIFFQIASFIFFKYSNSFIELFNLSTNKSDIITPLGISFIMLTGISYIADVKKKKLNAEKNIIDFALYISFFPKIIQGPIENAGNFLSQTKRKQPFDLTNFREGFIEFLFGMFMKMVIADRAAISVDYVFDDLSIHSGAEIIFAVFLFAIQIYADFAGYSIIALGSARILGYKLNSNFRQPYLSASVSEFWRRWHISLNYFLRDYIYIPLGGNRKGAARKYINILITFFVSGLWHGFNFGYIFWGILNGFYVVLEALFGKIKAKNSSIKSHKINPIGTAKTFILIVFSWIFFRAETLKNISIIFEQIFKNLSISIFLSDIKSIFVFSDYTLVGQTAKEHLILFVFVAVLFTVDILIQNKYISAKKLANGNRFLRWIIIYLLIFLTIIFGVYGYGYNSSSFIYTQF